MNQDYLKKDIERYMSRLDDLREIFMKDKALNAIVEWVVVKAADASYGAGMGGRHDDGGAGQMIERLKGFLQGVGYGQSSDTDNLGDYAEIYRKIEVQNDPKYHEYLRLKEIYGDIK